MAVAGSWPADGNRSAAPCPVGATFATGPTGRAREPSPHCPGRSGPAADTAREWLLVSARATAREWLLVSARATAREWLLSSARATAREWLLSSARATA